MSNTDLVMRSQAVRRGLPAVLGVLVVLSLLGLVPQLARRMRLLRELEQAGRENAVMEVLYPVYREVQSAARSEDWPELVTPRRAPLDGAAVQVLPDTLRAIAQSHAFDPAVMPVMVVSEGDRRLLRVEMALEGRYARLGPLLEDLIRLPAFESLDRLVVAQDRQADRVQLDLRMALE